jgi:hypothetical protein
MALPSHGWADDRADPAVAAPASAPTPTLCQAIDRGAAASNLPTDFFARLIWKESRLQPDAVSPAGAEGIAQFMPQTAALRGLANPFDPAEAIAASAHYLRDLAGQFGNLGLAAAAYNAGEAGVSKWLAGTGSLPAETEDYVFFVTGWTAEAWRSDDGNSPASNAAAATAAPTTPPPSCAEVAALLSEPGAGSPPVPASQTNTAWQPWGLQLAGSFSEARARASYATLQRQYASILAGRDPLVLRTVMRSRGTAPFFDVRVPAATRDEADALCAKLKAAGGACIVMKNTP